MTINITQRVAGVTVTLLALAALFVFAAYSYGESTRQSDTEVTRFVADRVDSAVTKRGTQAKEDQAAAVKRAVKTAKKAQWKKDNKRWKKYNAKQVKAADERGYSRGSSAGYSAGNSAGFSSGHSVGVDDGLEQGSDELTCSDDSDVPLPSCSY